MDSDCKKFVFDDDSPASAKPDSKAAWGYIFKGQAKKATAILRSVAGADHAVTLEFITLLIAKVLRTLKFQPRGLPRSLMAF